MKNHILANALTSNYGYNVAFDSALQPDWSSLIQRWAAEIKDNPGYLPLGSLEKFVRSTETEHFTQVSNFKVDRKLSLTIYSSYGPKPSKSDVEFPDATTIKQRFSCAAISRRELISSIICLFTANFLTQLST